VLVIANTNTLQRFDGFVLQDPDLNRHPRQLNVAYSNLGSDGVATVRQIYGARLFSGWQRTGTADVTALPVGLAPMEIQVWVPQPPLSF
jgi:hypothetical protein